MVCSTGCVVSEIREYHKQNEVARHEAEKSASWRVIRLPFRCVFAMVRGMSVLQSSPFTDQGSVVDIFPDLSVWEGIRAVIKQINANAGVA